MYLLILYWYIMHSTLRVKIVILHLPPARGGKTNTFCQQIRWTIFFSRSLPVNAAGIISNIFRTWFLKQLFAFRVKVLPNPIPLSKDLIVTTLIVCICELYISLPTLKNSNHIDYLIKSCKTWIQLLNEIARNILIYDSIILKKWNL